jgi:hypothetical protein
MAVKNRLQNVSKAMGGYREVVILSVFRLRR